MIQVILHLVGDFLVQTNWMAINKIKYTLTGYMACLLHCVVYTLGFAITYHHQPYAVLVIFLTHFVIDKFSLAKYWMKYMKNVDINLMPIWMYVWLTIITDNILHVIINYLSLLYL